MKLFRLLLTFTFVSLSAVASEADDVKAAFDNYKSAILSQEGSRAVALVSRRTVEEYQQYVDWALKADRATVEGLSFINRVQVILIRHRVPAEALRKMDGRSCFVYAVDRDWIGKNGVIRLTIGETAVSGNRATAQVLIGGQKSAARLQFIKEDGAWKYDLVPTIRDSSTALAAVAKQQGLTENELIFRLTETVSGKRVPESIWDPVQ